jgi:hypothetical protein
VHLSDHELYLVSDDEADPRRIHVASCASCAARVEGARDFDRKLPALLQRLDHDASAFGPPLRAIDVLAVARQRTRERRARRRRAWLGGLGTLVAASAAAAAIPSTRWHALVERFTRAAAASPERSSSVPYPAASGAAATRGSIAVAASPAVTVSFRFVQTAGVIRVVLTDAAQIRIEHAGGAPRYVVSPQGVGIENAESSASYVIGVPRSSDSVDVRIAGRLVFAKHGVSVTGMARSDGPGVYRLDFTSLSRSLP